LSTLVGLPGGWWIAGTIPADLAQYYQNVIQMAQKLAYSQARNQETEEIAEQNRQVAANKLDMHNDQVNKCQ